MMYNYTKIKIMKKIIYLLVCSVIGLFSSCSDFLSAPSKSSFSEEIVFSNEKLTENMIFDIVTLINSGVINIADLAEFSDGLKESVDLLLHRLQADG